jgi:hypothetical protein
MHLTQHYFTQECPVCGRRMQVRIELLGKQIACGHCAAVTVARDNSDHSWIGSLFSMNTQRMQPRICKRLSVRPVGTSKFPNK